jgi:hypothetical protein
LLGITAPAFAASTPTCSDAPTALTATVNDPNVDLSWVAPGTCTPTKYAIEVIVQYGLVDGVGCDGGTSDTLSYTSEKGNPAPTTFSFALADLTPPAGYVFCADTQVKVKALTTQPHGPNKSQNNPFSDIALISISG